MTDLKHKVTEAVEHAKHVVTETIHKAEHALKEAAHSSEKAASDAATKAKELTDEAAAKASSAGEKLAPQIAPRAIVFSLNVCVSITARPELRSCLPGKSPNSSTATYRESGDHATA